MEQFRRLVKPGHEVPPYADITLGFDGGKFHDGTALVGTEIATGYQWAVGVWEEPYNIKGWEVPSDQVELAVAEAFRRWNVWRLYADPPYWESYVSKWAGQYGEKRAVEWGTTRPK